MTLSVIIPCRSGSWGIGRLKNRFWGGFLSSKNGADRVKSVSDWVKSVIDRPRFVTD